MNLKKFYALTKDADRVIISPDGLHATVKKCLISFPVSTGVTQAISVDRKDLQCSAPDEILTIIVKSETGVKINEQNLTCVLFLVTYADQLNPAWGLQVRREFQTMTRPVRVVQRLLRDVQTEQRTFHAGVFFHRELRWSHEAYHGLTLYFLPPVGNFSNMQELFPVHAKLDNRRTAPEYWQTDFHISHTGKDFLLGKSKFDSQAKTFRTQKEAKHAAEQALREQLSAWWVVEEYRGERRNIPHPPD